MICIKADFPQKLRTIDDELNAIYHSKTHFFYLQK